MTDYDLQLMLSTIIDYYGADREGLKHVFNVFAFAQDLANDEKIEDVERHIMLTAALFHHIGEREYRLQDKPFPEGSEDLFGPNILRDLLETSDLTSFELEAVAILVQSHAQPNQINNVMHKLLREAILLFELDDKQASPEEIKAAYDNEFYSESGKKRLRTLYPEAF